MSSMQKESAKSKPMMPLLLIAFYQFKQSTAAPRLKDLIRQLPELRSSSGSTSAIRGTVLLAKEGVNATLAGPRPVVEKVFGSICKLGQFDNPVVNRTAVQQVPFSKLKIKVKKEIVTLRACPSPSATNGCAKKINRLNPTQWNRLLRDEEVLLLDIRNDFEYAMGSFTGAVNPRINSFGEMSQYIEKLPQKLMQKRPQISRKRSGKKLAIFCTGGIRCDKILAYLQEQDADIDDIYLPEGGIVRYLNEVSPKDSLWEGDCFVFDDRISIGHEG